MNKKIFVTLYWLNRRADYISVHGQEIYSFSLNYKAISNAVRLHGPLSGNGIGRVEVFYKEQWRLVCSYNWDINDAVVVCRQLGYKYAVRAFQEPMSHRWLEQNWLKDVNCTGNEQNLTRCPHQLVRSGYECGNYRFLSAAVECSTTGKIFICSILLLHKETKTKVLH